MATAEKPPAVPLDPMVELQEAIDRVVKGVRGPEAIRRACGRMDQLREELRRRSGETKIAVKLTRGAHDEG